MAIAEAPGNARAGAGAVSDARPPHDRSYQPPLHYRALFELGRAWRYRVASERQYNDPGNPAADQYGNVTESGSSEFSCEVKDVRAFHLAIASTVECSGDDEIQGIYGATSEGLFRLTRLPEREEELEGLREGEPLIAAAPVADRRVEKYPEGEAEHAIERTPEGWWCRNDSDSIGDEGALSICFAEGLGIVRYYSMWAGGSSQEVTIELVR